LYAINPDGTLRWRFETGDGVYSSPAIGSDGTIYVGSFDHNLYAINADGSLKWKFETGGTVKFSPAIGSDGTIYVILRMLSLCHKPGGTLKWKLETGHRLFSRNH
jgi:outer membrane protein assembly factor BamB